MKFEDFKLGSAYPIQKKEEKSKSVFSEWVPQEDIQKKQEKEVSTSSLPYYEETENMTLDLSQLQSRLGDCLQMIDDEVMKGYIVNLNQLPVVKPQEGLWKRMPEVQFFQITELVYQEDEFSVYKLSSIFRALANKPCTLVLMIQSDGDKNKLYLGVRSQDEQYSSGTMRKMLEQNLLGMFPGSKISQYSQENLEQDLNTIKAKCLSEVTCIADFKQKEENVHNKEYVQGLEKFIYSMKGKEYTAFFIADNLSYQELNEKRCDYESIYTQLSPFADMQFNFVTSEGNSSSYGESKGVSRSTNIGISKGMSTSVGNADTYTAGTTRGTSETVTRGENVSESKGATNTLGMTKGQSSSTADAYTEGISGSVGVSAKGVSAGMSKFKSNTHTVTQGTSSSVNTSTAIAETLTNGKSNSVSKGSSNAINESNSHGNTYTSGTQIGNTYSVGEGFNLVNTNTLTDNFGISKGVTLNAKNMALMSMLKRLEKQIDRMNECESLGMWNVAAYFVGESAAETETAANTYQSVVSGVQSGIERAAVNTWLNEETVTDIFQYIRNFMHPRFLYSGFREAIVNPSTMVSSDELAIHMGLPRRSIKGLPVIEHAVFAQEVLSRKECTEKTIRLGRVHYLGEDTDTEVELDLNSLAMHTFITGSTGAGKSNAVYHILEEAQKKEIPFLVVEPAKGEYKKIFGNVKCFGTNPNEGEMLQINPFAFPKEIHVLEHIDRIIEIFNVCWPMYAAMPAVLKDAVERAYIAAGWDMELSVNTKIDGLFPTFDDVVSELRNVINNSDYSADTKGDYIGSLSTRLKSLTNGINGKIFVANEMDLTNLFDKSAILDISRVGSMETKALIMGLVVLKLQEYRMSNAKEMNASLKHITVLEEAHNILKKTSAEQNQESSNLQGKSVEMLTNIIAEIRTYGEGFLIVDQAPGLLDIAAIRNTNTKIVLRLPEGNDRKITGMAMALDEKQITELSKLPTGVAAVYQNDWQEAVLCKMPKYNMIKEERVKNRVEVHTRNEQANRVLHLLLKKNYMPQEIESLCGEIYKLNMSAKVRKNLILNIRHKNYVFEWAVADFINKNYNLSNVFAGTYDNAWESLDDLAKIMIGNIEAEFKGFSEQEMLTVLYYVCHIMHEKYKDSQVIEKLRCTIKERVI